METTIVERVLHVDDRIDIDEKNLTPIQEFYRDAKVFLTGGSGFLGQILIEKLLRSCPVSTIYVLMRNKKGKDIETRLNEMFNDQLFNRMRKVRPDFRQMIVAVEGDCELPELGLNVQDKKLLIDEVNIVFHAAATVRFDEKLKKAAAINVRATRDLSLIAQQMKQLKSFVQVSTTYSNCVYDLIEEKVYPPSTSHHNLIRMIDSIDDFLLEKLTPTYVMIDTGAVDAFENLIGKYPNTYIYTKQIAEDAVKQETRSLPAGIFRPAAVVSSYKEPVAGWINNVYGPTGAFYGIALGLIRVMLHDKKCEANIVPVDMCMNALIVSAWDIAKKFEKAKDENGEFQTPVYNYGSSDNKPITWEEYKLMCCKYGHETPSTLCMWTYMVFSVKSYTKFLVMTFFLHLIPAAVVDAILFCRGKKTRLIKAYRKINRFMRVIGYFSTRSFIFKSTNLHEMMARVSKKDKEVFFCDLRELDWDDYFVTYVVGARIHLTKDPVETIPEGKKHYRRLEWANRALMSFLGFLAIATIWLLISTIF